MKTYLASTLLAALISAATPAIASSPELVNNGTFESYAGGNFDEYRVLSAGSTDLVGWTIGGTSVDLITASYFGTISGRSIDMLGSPGPGWISQTLETTVGQTYRLTFDLSQNRLSNPTAEAKTLLVSFNDASPFVYTAVYADGEPSRVAHESVFFTATAASTLLTFTSGASGSSGAVLDNVSVTAVPEPESYAMLLAGLGLMLTMARRRGKLTN